MTHICIGKLTTIGSDNGLSPGRRQAIIWTNAGILSIRTLETNFSEILSEIHAFSFKKMHLKMSSGKRRPFGLGLNVLTGRSCHFRQPVAYLMLNIFLDKLQYCLASFSLTVQTNHNFIFFITQTALMRSNISYAVGKRVACFGFEYPRFTQDSSQMKYN